MGVHVCWVTSVVSIATLWTIAHQAPLSMGLPRQEYWSGLPCSPPGDLPDPSKDWAYISCISCIARWFFTTSTTWEAPGIKNSCCLYCDASGEWQGGGNWREQLEHRAQRKERWQPDGWAWARLVWNKQEWETLGERSLKRYPGKLWSCICARCFELRSEYWQQPSGSDEYFSLLSSTSVWAVNSGLEKTTLCMGSEIPRADLGPCQSEDPA